MRFGQNWSNNKYFFFFLIYDNRRRDKKVSVSPSPLQDFSRENLSMHPWRTEGEGKIGKGMKFWRLRDRLYVFYRIEQN